jgi:hypothetical protein
MNHTTDTTLLNTKTQLTRNESAFVQCLLYFDVFQYPLTAKEVYRFCESPQPNESACEAALETLVKKKIIKKKYEYYFVNDSEHVVERRIIGNAMAQKILPKALRYGRFIAKFPFVETVCISGGLSKNYIDEHGDVDFFIITKPQRLWLCRSLLVGFKKIFLLNSRKYFCVNYFVDSNNLSIPDRNIFTATEIATLIPVSNQAGYIQFLTDNNWIATYFPNINIQHQINDRPIKQASIKPIGEWLFRGKLGDFTDKFLFRLTLKVWQKKFKHFSQDDFDLHMRSRKNVSKHHPGGFQEKVLNRLSAAQEKFCNTHQIIFSD